MKRIQTPYLKLIEGFGFICFPDGTESEKIYYKEQGLEILDLSIHKKQMSDWDVGLIKDQIKKSEIPTKKEYFDVKAIQGIKEFAEAQKILNKKKTETFYGNVLN